MSSWSSDIKKLCFFDEKKYKDILNINTLKKEEEDHNNNNIIDNENKETNDNIIKNSQKIDDININNIFISGPREIHAIYGLIFINGKLIHEKNGKMIRENLIMKIVDNKIIDLYRIFNGVYYSFEIKVFKHRPYFIVIGGNFNEYNIDDKIELFMTTSIKIYDATNFIVKKTEKYPPANILNSKEEPYPKLLIKNIKLMKRIEDGKIMCEVDELLMKGYESFQNINSFAINSEFSHVAISLDKGDIILIYAYPNLIECDNKAITMMYLPKINDRDKGHITNLFFTEINKFNTVKRILYASTSKIIYYYEWKYNNKSYTIEEKDIKLGILNPNGPGGYSGCIDIKDRYLLLGSANDDVICEYENLEISKTWFFVGKKANVYYFKDYIVFVVVGENISSLQIYDKKNALFIYYKEVKKKIIGLCCDYNNIYVIFEKSPTNKYIMRLTEKSLKEKIQIFFKKNLFDIAIMYAENYSLDSLTLSNISKIFAEYDYNNENYYSSIQKYIKTIGYYEPNYVIQKFNNYKKIEYLIIYLEKLLEYFETKMKINDDYTNYSKLLFCCYIFENNIQNFKKYINKKSTFLNNELLEYIIKICLDINEKEFALNFFKEKKLYIYYIELLLYINEKEEALDFIRDLLKEGKPMIDNKNKEKDQFSHYKMSEMKSNLSKNNAKKINKIPHEEMLKIFNKFAIYFLNEDNNDKNIINKGSVAFAFFEIVLIFIYKNVGEIKENDLNIVIHNFLFFDKYFIMIFDKLFNYPLIFDEKIIHRRIELYLAEINNGENEIKKDKITENIIDLLSNQKYKNKYDIQYLTFLFKYYNFKEGLEFLTKQTNFFNDIILLFFNKKEYKQILSFFKNNDIKDKLIWTITLQLFLQELKTSTSINNETEQFQLKIYFKEFLLEMVDNNIFTPIEILESINQINNEISINFIKDFCLYIIDKENKNLINNLVKSKEYEAGIHDIDEEITNIEDKPVSLILRKCDECREGIECPLVFFKCGHYFHDICLHFYYQDFRRAHCPKCVTFRNQIITKNKQSEKIYNALNNEERLEQELKKYENHIDFINVLYSKGLFKFNKDKKRSKSCYSIRK